MKDDACLEGRPSMSESQACIPTFLTTHALLIVRWGVVAGGLLAARCCNHYGSTLHAIAGHDSSNRLVGMFQASGTTPPSKACVPKRAVGLSL